MTAIGRIAGVDDVPADTTLVFTVGSRESGDESEVILVRTNHGANNEADSGVRTLGPCEGAYLDALEVAVADGEVHVADDRYEFVHAGPKPADGDLSSTSNDEF